MGEPDGNATRFIVPIASVVALRLSLSLRQIIFATPYITMTRSSGREGGETLLLSTRLRTVSSTDSRFGLVRRVNSPSYQEFFSI